MKTDKFTYSFLSLRDKLYRSALGFLNNEEEAKDALQDTYLKLWKSDLLSSDVEVKGKLFKVLRNICIDRLRKMQPISIKEYDPDSMSIIPDFSEDIERLEPFLYAGLTDIQLTVYNLVAKDGLEYEDIASKLNISIEAVRMNMSRARKKIRENYKKLDI